MIKCSTCGEYKESSQFSKKSGNRGYAYRCKACHNEYCRSHYKNNVQKYVSSTANNRKNKRQYVANYKLEKGCYVCGFNKSSYALDLHHKNSEDKTGHPSFITVNNGINKIDNELDKCIVLCSNCHRMVHSGEIVLNDAG